MSSVRTFCVQILSLLAIFGSFVGLCDSLADKHRFRYHCPICDDFDLESDPNTQEYADFLKELGFSQESIKKLQESKDTKIDIGHDRKNDNYYFIIFSECAKDFKNIFHLGKEFSMTLCDGHVVPTTITSEVDEDRQVIEVKVVLKGKGQLLMEYIEDGGMLLHVESNGKQATLKYKVSERNVIASQRKGMLHLG